MPCDNALLSRQSVLRYSLSLSNLVVAVVWHQARKTNFLPGECTLMVLDSNKKQCLTKHHAKMRHYRFSAFPLGKVSPKHFQTPIPAEVIRPASLADSALRCQSSVTSQSYPLCGNHFINVLSPSGGIRFYFVFQSGMKRILFFKQNPSSRRRTKLQFMKCLFA